MFSYVQIFRPVLLTMFLFFLGCSSPQGSGSKSDDLPEGFVYLHEVAPSILQEMRYYGSHNFLGRPVDGYESPKCILTEKAALALLSAQKELEQRSLSLKVYDCYRPQRAVDSFIAWAKDLKGTTAKDEFYPKVDKTHLFRDGYIASKSGHSRGSTVDLTIVPLPVPKQADFKVGMKLAACYLPGSERFNDNSLDFGTGFDCFDPLAHTAHPAVGKMQKRNRMMLKSLMEKFGFKNLAVEWWHYTLVEEPFSDRYFDFVVR